MGTSTNTDENYKAQVVAWLRDLADGIESTQGRITKCDFDQSNPFIRVDNYQGFPSKEYDRSRVRGTLTWEMEYDV